VARRSTALDDHRIDAHASRPFDRLQARQRYLADGVSTAISQAHQTIPTGRSAVP
jgi:hypothetical protein